MYFHNTFAMYKHHMKKTWAVISETLNKNKKRKDEPLTFKCNGRDLPDDIEIANEFNRFFANIGENLASNMEQFDNHELSYKTYLQTPHEQNCRFELIDENATAKAIDYIDNKPSSGHDGISNVLLKYVKLEISKPLTLVINQMITTGIFPESLKIAKPFQSTRKENQQICQIIDQFLCFQQYQRYLNVLPISSYKSTLIVIIY